MPKQDLNGPEISCMLDASDFRDRMAWIDRLNSAGLRSYRRRDNRFQLTYESSVVA